MKNKKIARAFFAGAFVCSLSVKAQLSLSGQVKTNNGEPIPFAIVGLKNTQLAATADADGNFKFKNLENDVYILATKSVGYLDGIDTINIIANAEFNPVLIASNKNLDEVVVNATRVDKGNGMAYNNIDSETLKKQNTGQDAPYMLNQLSNVVVNSDAGNAVGYTGIRIRGSDATRINVTINGVPINDAESQGSYFVDMPDLVSSTNNIQVQRGVGASSNGAGSFGATINFQTNDLKDKSYANVISTAGSYGTLRNTLAAGTGLLNNKFTLDARASNISSNGYIDRAKSNLQSYYIAAGYYGKKSVLKFINFLGQEKTYQAWYYVPEDSIKNGNRTYNPSGEYYDATGALQHYKNETDNYKQNNFQLHFIHQVNSRMNFNITAHYTKGKGYYEQYKNPAKEALVGGSGAKLSKYGLENVIIGDDTIRETNLIRRLWLDNDFAGAICNFNYTANSRLLFTLGGGYNTYFGKHFGRVMWAQYASNAEIDHQYYLDVANKNDANAYLKTNYKPFSNLNVFVDLQARQVDYTFVGFNDLLEEKKQIQSYTFFNPKFGLSYDANKNLNIYASLAFANKEPNRDDFVQSSPQSRPKHEQLMDIEAGAHYTKKKITLSANFYNMQYKNQLVLNGQVNNVGAYNRVNVASSYRRGVEVEVNIKLNKYLALGANLAVSQNKIAKFVEYIDSSNADYSISTQYKNEYRNTDISFSPNTVSSLVLTIKPLKGLEISLIDKNVGLQYLDNTTNVKRSIKPYNVLDVRLNYTIKTKLIPEIGFMLSVYNVLNTKYETNGYTYSYYTDAKLYTYNYFAPSAPLNFLGGISLKF
ncbi:TonB-dependent receptor [Aurantibacillus circumpalustris]|uniref:TonB-dependent receptor n=1 Tax=Aurantibacillus circumpalustris TaxID=3036359 RepID=UPI00295B31DC|nr:TonB-dependent receptor [Aurantibacillus circumpalustris]